MNDMNHTMGMEDHSGDGTGGAVQDLTGSGSTTRAEAIISQQEILSGADHSAHMDDTAKRGEHLELLSLFPDASDPNTAVAINGGSWFDGSTWAGGSVPGAGQDVYIPKGISVVYDGVSTDHLDTVGVDGELHFAVDTDTRMEVDSLFTGASSTLTIGVEGNPVQQDVKAEIVIHRDGGSISNADDPLELSTGVVTHGAVRIAGQDKADHLKASVDPEQGDTFLIFDEAPIGWQPGDKLVVAGTRLLGENSFEDEIVEVRSVVEQANGTYRVNLEQALAYDHIPPENSAGLDFQVPVANYTRNVFIGGETEEAAYWDDGKTIPIDERGHVMFMHNGDVSVQNAEFYELGRTDKSQILSDDNVAGRYAAHFHRTGGSADEEPALIEGSAVWGSPGWGIVHHDSNLDVISNAVFGVNGGAIIAEAGNETGAWKDNITIQTTGEYVTHNSEHSGKQGHPAERQQVLDDSFAQGIGFGFKSRMIETTDNIAVSSNGAAYSFWPMGKEGGSPSHINPEVSDYETLHGYDPFFGQDNTGVSQIPNRIFEDNEAIVTHVALNTSADKRPSGTDVPTIIEGLVAWEVGAGVLGFYQRDYLIKDSVFVGLQDGMNSKHQSTAAGYATTGVLAREFHELKLVNNHFENFDFGIWEKNHEDGQLWTHVILGNTYVGVGQETLLGIDGSSPSNYTIHDDSTNWQNSVDLGQLDATVNLAESDLVMTAWYDRFSVVVDKTDSLGSQQLAMGSEKTRYKGASQKEWWGENAENHGYYVQDGKYYLIVQAAVGDRVTGTVGTMDVAIELAFIESPADLPDGAVNNGALPAHLDANGIGAFEIVDQREIGKSGNQLINPDSDDNDGDMDHGGTDGGTDHGGTDGGTDHGGHDQGIVLQGTNGNDTLDGTAGNDSIMTGSGNNLVFAGNGDDYIEAEGGQDKLYGGQGSDEIVAGAGSDTVMGADGADSIDGGAGNDNLWGGLDNDTILGGTGHDRIGGGAQDDDISAGGGNDTIWAGNGNDLINAGTEDDEVRAGAGNDTVYGGEGNDLLIGKSGSDELWGGDGFDVLNGGKGDDTLRGGADSDIIVFSKGADVVIDFGEGDQIDFSEVFGINDFDDVLEHLSGIEDAEIDDGNGNSITLIGIRADELENNDFLF